MKNKPIIKFIFLPAIILTLLIIASIIINTIIIKHHHNKMIRNEALSNFNKDVATRY